MFLIIYVPVYCSNAGIANVKMREISLLFFLKWGDPFFKTLNNDGTRKVLPWREFLYLSDLDNVDVQVCVFLGGCTYFMELCFSVSMSVSNLSRVLLSTFQVDATISFLSF